jgi:cytoskeletal protein RodZ
MAMPGIGETLREARTAAGIQLDDAERTIRIRIRYLDALENEEWDVLPGDAYVRGFLHTYADYLGLDGAALVNEYDRQEVPAQAERPMDAPFEPPRPMDGGNPTLRRLGWGAIFVAAALAALFIVLGITGGSSESPKKQHHQHHHGGDKQGSAQSSTTTTTTPSEATVSLTPTGTVWVCLVDQSGKPLVNGETLTTGDTRGPFKARDMQLTLGNGAIQVKLDGKQVSIPSAANPVGFDLTPQGAKPLSTADSPTCA